MMDAVKAFNAELSSLYEVKPPISKAKMTALTRGAIKAIKFYKHVVQSVEKFILKCKPEYKVPGLYVIDSIVRQSRHQFGTDKDVFAPRFAKNMQQTFVNLYKCPPEDKSKVIRVLNLWQKNQVFAPNVVQPLFDFADPNHPIHKEVNIVHNNGTTAGAGAVKGSPALQKTPTKTPSSTDPATLAQLGTIANNPSTLDSNTIAQLQQLHRLLLRQGDGAAIGKPDGSQAQVQFDRKLLDFDYGSDEEDDATNPSPKQTIDTVGTLLSNPEVLRQLQTLQQSISNSSNTEYDLEKLRKLQEMKQQEEEFDKHLAQTLPNLPFAAECEFKPNTNSPSAAAMFNNFFMQTDLSQPPPGYKGDDKAHESEVEFVGTNDDMEVIDIDHGDSRSPSKERYGRRRRSRSREWNRRRRSRSRSRQRKHRSRSRERDREREKEKEKEREKDRERRKRGLPPIKKDNLSVCSTTLWVGHLSKLVHQEDLSDTFGEFGEIVSIDLIIPRGCAFIVMHRRQDASRCLTKLKNHKMQGKAITLAWAPGKGVKGKDLKDYWEGDLGVSYIPYVKLRADMDLDLLEDGGMIDEDTAPEWMRTKMSAMSNINKDADITATSSNLNAVSFPPPAPEVDTSQPPPMPNTTLLAPPPAPMSLPMVGPFQINNRLLGVPPGMLPNVPMGVPPPNLPLMGMGLIAPPMAPQMSNINMDKNVTGDGQPMLPFSLLPPHPPPMAMPLQPPIHDDHMDVDMEMEDAKVNEQMNDYSNGNMMKRRDMQPRGDRNNRERERDNSRDRWEIDGHRDRGRWSHEERRDREKALNDRLREMAGDSSFREEQPTSPLLERPPMFPNFNNGDAGMMEPDRFQQGLGDYPDHYSEYDMGPPRLPIDFEPPPPPLEFEGPPLEYDRRFPVRGERFDDRGFFPRGPPRFRGPAHDMFGPRGGGGPPPIMRPPMFHGGRNGPRGPLWADKPRYDGQDFYHGPSTRHDRNDRERRRYNRHQDDFDYEQEEGGSSRRSNRWSSGSPPPPRSEMSVKSEPLVDRSNESPRVDIVDNNIKVEATESCQKTKTSIQGDNMTPLHDEPAEPEANKPLEGGDSSGVKEECITQRFVGANQVNTNGGRKRFFVKKYNFGL